MRRILFVLLLALPFFFIASAHAGDFHSEALSQELSVEGLNYTYTAPEDMEVCGILLNLPDNLTKETCSATFDALEGANYDVQLASDVTKSAWIYLPEGTILLRKGDAINIQCTNDNLSGSGVSNLLYGTIRGKDNRY